MPTAEPWPVELGAAQPTYATRPSPGARHDLEAIRVVARALGTPLMPWQQAVARVATERHPERPEQYRYRTVVLTVPRQAGKTTLMRTVLTQRALARAGRRSFYTAQTGKDARERWKDLVQAISTSPLRSHVTVRRGAGDSGLTFPNGSSIRPFAPTAESLHGYTPHDVFCDEIFAHTEDEGEALIGAIGPAQVTLPDRQLWLVSTAGSAESTFLRRWVERGREAIDDPDTSIAYFEWSGPEDVDPYEPANWQWHPAIGHTITDEDLAELATKHTLGEWLRAYFNRWTVAHDTLFDQAQLEALGREQHPPLEAGEISIAYEAAIDRSVGTIWAAWIDPRTERPAARMLQRQPGIEWMPASVLALAEQLQPRAIGADDSGTVRTVTEQLRRADPTLELTTLGARDFATAWEGMRARIRAASIAVELTPGFREACDNAVQRTMGQGWALDRMRSRGQIADLIAPTIALRLLETAEPAAPAPNVAFA